MLATRKRSAARIGVFVLISPRPLVMLMVWLPDRVSRTTPGAPAATRALASCCRAVRTWVRSGVAAAVVATRTAAVSPVKIAPESLIRLGRRDLRRFSFGCEVMMVMVFLLWRWFGLHRAEPFG